MRTSRPGRSFTPTGDYTSYEFGTALEDLDLRRSVGRTGIMLRQRDGGILLRCAEERALQPDGLSDPSRGDERHCTVHRDPLQSEKASLRDRLPSAQRSARRLPIRTHGRITTTGSLSKKFRADQALEADIRNWVKAWNDDARPFIWTNSAEQILDSLARLLQRTTGAGHEPSTGPTHGVSWWAVRAALSAAVLVLPDVDDAVVRRRGVAEHRYRSVRYYHTETGAWLAARPTVWLERIEGRSDRPIGGVPARELAQFIEDHLLARPVLGPVPAGGSLRHGSALTHRQPHGLGVPAQQAPGR